MQNPFKEFLYFSRGERRGILVLITGIILVFLSGYIYIYQRENRPLSDEVIRRQATAMAEYESFIASIQEKEQKWDNRLKPSSQKQPTTVSLARFNPNIADSVIFCRLGLPGWMARNILRYRSKGGKFHKAEDFRKIYGMTEKQYQTLLPYIHITPEDTETRTVQLYSSPASNDSAVTFRIAPEKYPSGTLVDLNRADTTELKKIPGIGSGIARLIIGYRQRLGGFYNITQLQDTEFFIRSQQDLQAVRQYMECFHPTKVSPPKQYNERFHPATKLLYWLVLTIVISTSDNHLVYAAYAALMLLTAADGRLTAALIGSASFGLLWATNVLLPDTLFSFMLVLFPRIIAVGISMMTLIGRNEASRILFRRGASSFLFQEMIFSGQPHSQALAG